VAYGRRIVGFMTEQGPFRVNKDMTLSMNPYSWNNLANMVFIEAPCGVGFSYSDDKDDYKTDDAQTAADNYALVQAFFDRFPQYRTNSLYITSESYGGHYMPTLAQEIVNKQKDGDAANPATALAFKGFAVGNPATTFYSAIPAGLDTYWGHQLVSKPLWDSYQKNCGPDVHHKNFTICEGFFVAFYQAVGDLNPYALDYPVCVDDSRSPARAGRSQRHWFMNNALESLKKTFFMSDESLATIRKAIKLEPVDGYEPCADDYMTTYLNQASVKTAIHVKSDIEWVDCSRSIRYNQMDGAKSMTPIYNYLIDNNFGLDILVYSGDDDDVCATIGTQDWIWGLGYSANTNTFWKPYTVNDQTAGYLTQWKDQKLAFATVRGAGHEVPTYKPEIALYIFDQYLQGKLTN
jgi:carboxypeptidase C (cathepsin A)